MPLLVKTLVRASLWGAFHETHWGAFHETQWKWKLLVKLRRNASLLIGCSWEMGHSSEQSSLIPSSRADAQLPQGLALPLILYVPFIMCCILSESWLMVKLCSPSHFHPGSWFSITMWRAWSCHLRKLGQLGRPGDMRAWVTGTCSVTAVVELREPGIGHS